MARPYASEMAKLGETLAWAAGADIASLCAAVRTASLSPLLAIGSGGSLSAAHALAWLHQWSTGRMAAISTPLDAVAMPLDGGVASWLLSAGGGNVDILAATTALIRREPRQVAVMCGREDSPLAQLCRDHPFTDLLLYPPPAGKDGFLATNSLLGFSTLLTRAYAPEDASAEAIDQLGPIVAERSNLLHQWKTATQPLWGRGTTLVLHGPNTKLGAIDLESKFTEAALGNLQLADYRNFAHGRHHWLAKRGEVSSVLAFITGEDRKLAERTLALIPHEIPLARLELGGGPAAANLASLAAALRITEWAGQARGIDPGRPGVPDFGRRLYNLPLPKVPGSPRIKGLSERDVAAITRKSGLTPQALAALGELSPWTEALAAFWTTLRETIFAGVVLDYDGTVVDSRHRFEPASEAMAGELLRIIDSGARLAIATGRGVSVRRDLQRRLPKAVWGQVLIGYYNGADVAPLDDDDTPQGGTNLCDALAPVAEALRLQPELAGSATQTNRPCQITLEANRAMPENRLWDLTRQVLLIAGRPDVTVTRSSHSIDIVAPGVTKLNVLRRLQAEVGDGAILTIGDRGRWPGNDHELLASAYSLSVDETSLDPKTCWNLGAPGQRGVAVTREYLASFDAGGAGLRLRKAVLA